MIVIVDDIGTWFVPVPLLADVFIVLEIEDVVFVGQTVGECGVVDIGER